MEERRIQHTEMFPPSRSYYNAGCRCDGCRRENAAYIKNWREEIALYERMVLGTAPESNRSTQSDGR